MAKYWASSKYRGKDNPLNSTLVCIDQRTVPKLLELMNRTGYSFRLVNGERIFGSPPPGWIFQDPPRGAEIFVGKLPRDCYENEIVPVFAECGMIYGMRLKLESDGRTCGSCFITYTTPQAADCAVSVLNCYEIRPGYRMEVVHTTNCRLYIASFPRNIPANEFVQVIRRLTEGVESVIFCKKYSKGYAQPFHYALVNYHNHFYAAMAKGRLFYELRRLWNYNVVVHWSVDPLLNCNKDFIHRQKNYFLYNYRRT